MQPVELQGSLLWPREHLWGLLIASVVADAWPAGSPQRKERTLQPMSLSGEASGGNYVITDQPLLCT